MGEPNPVAEAKERQGHTVLQIKQPSDRYLDEWLHMDFPQDLRPHGFFPNAKEVTESMAAFNHIQNFVSRTEGWSLDDEDTLLIAVGDGAHPRTASIFAFRSQWECHAVDPQANREGKVEGIDHLYSHPELIQDVSFEAEKVAVVAVHNHANLEQSLASIEAEEMVVLAMPCCVDQSLDVPPDREEADWGIHSPHRNIKLWEFLGDDDGY